MRVVITGGAGFVGSHVAERLLTLGHTVVCLDNLVTGRRENIAGLEANPRFSFVLHNVSEYIAVTDPVDLVFHLASPASPVDYLQLPIATLKAGSLGTLHAVGLAKAKGARFVLASTSEVYGDPLVNPQPESYWGHVNPIGPRSVYDEAKRFAEALTVAYRRQHGVDTRIARIFNTYGPRMRSNDGRVVSNFIVQALAGEPLTVYGDGSQTRSLCYVSDLVEGLIRLGMLDSDSAEIGGPINLGNPTEMSVAAIAALVLELAGSGGCIVREPLPEDDPKVRCPDIGRARRLLNWEPSVDARTGIALAVAYFRDALVAPSAAPQI